MKLGLMDIPGCLPHMLKKDWVALYQKNIQEIVRNSQQLAQVNRQDEVLKWDEKEKKTKTYLSASI